MSIWNIALPVLGLMGRLAEERKVQVAEQTGLSVETVSKVSGAVNDLLTRDERARAAVMEEIDRARAHDTAMNAAQDIPLVNLLRGLVRPVITLTAFFWYVYARCTGVEMLAEDYAVIGGILAFWFGVRPFEKATSAARGSPAK